MVLDIIHVAEYVWKAAHVFHREGSLELALGLDGLQRILEGWDSPPRGGGRSAGAEAVLKLRVLRASRDFDAYWDFHEAREYSGTTPGDTLRG